MPSEEFLERVRKDLAVLKDFWVVLYGSHARGDATPRSDIDIAIITRSRDRRANARLLYRILGRVPGVYDVKIYEELPLEIKARIFEEGIVVFGDPGEVRMYMRFYWKIWKDLKKRVRENRFASIRERIRILRKLRKIERNAPRDGTSNEHATDV